MNAPPDRNDPFGGRNFSLRAAGEFQDYRWEFRGDIVGDSAREWIDLQGTHGGAGGGSSGGALPFADLGYTVLGHFGSFGWSAGGWSRKSFKRRVYHPETVSGVVSADVASVMVRFEDDDIAEARLFESGDERVRFFFLVHSPKRVWTELIARNAEGELLETRRKGSWAAG